MTETPDLVANVLRDRYTLQRELGRGGMAVVYLAHDVRHDDRLLTGMAIFIEYPFLAAIIGIALLGLGRRTGRRTAVAGGVVWLLYAVYELGMQQRWLCSGECNVRIDLLVIYPALLLSSLVAGASFLRRSRNSRPPA